MENGDQTTHILLGRPFLKTSKTKIDVHSGTLTMEFDDEIVKFNFYDAMKYPDDEIVKFSFLKLQQSGNVPYIMLPVSNEI